MCLKSYQINTVSIFNINFLKQSLQFYNFGHIYNLQNLLQLCSNGTSNITHDFAASYSLSLFFDPIKNETESYYYKPILE